VGGFDEKGSPLGAKGLGELTAVSMAPAIGNAVYHATAKNPVPMKFALKRMESHVIVHL